jgi:hypothetical protein
MRVSTSVINVKDSIPNSNIKNMPSDTIDKVKRMYSLCESKKKEIGGIDGTYSHICGKKIKHKGKHKCIFCTKEWENETNISRRNEEAK